MMIATSAIPTMVLASDARTRATRVRRAALITAVAGALVAFAPSPVAAQAVGLGTAADFGVLGGAAVTNTGPTIVNGSVGVWAGTSITGFPPGSIVPGTGVLRSADTVAQQAQADLTTAYLDAAGRACGATIPAASWADRCLRLASTAWVRPT